MSTTTTLYKTGEECRISGVYAFEKYTDGTTWPSPTMNERSIPLSRGETFPPVRSSNKAAFWRLSRRA